MANIERISMAGEGSSSPDVAGGATATLARSEQGADIAQNPNVKPAKGGFLKGWLKIGPKTPEDVVKKESSKTELPAAFSDAFEGDASSKTDPSLSPQDAPNPNNIEDRWFLGGSRQRADQQAQPEPADAEPDEDDDPFLAGFGGMGGRGDGGGSGDDGGEPPPEPPRVPEGPANPEWETSPERGRWLVEEIIRLRTDPSISYEERYSLRDGKGNLYLPWLYDQLQNYVYGISRIRNERDPWDRYIREPETVDASGQAIPGKIIGVKGIHETPVRIEYDEDGKTPIRLISDEGNKAAEATTSFRVVTDQEKSSLTTSLGNLIALDAERSTPAEQRLEIQRQLLIHMRLAHEKGLLQGADQVLSSLYRDLKGIPANQTRRLISQRMEEAYEAAGLTFDSKSTDPEVVNLNGIWEPYIRWARQRLELSLQGQAQSEYREGEFRLPQEEGEDKETYWEIGSYPKYYHITARTEEQFLIAKESFLKMIQDGSLGKDPSTIYEHVNNFKDAFGGEGGRQAKSGNISKEFLLEQRLELEGRLYVFGADYSNETYNPQQYKQFMTAMAVNEGPARWPRLLRAGEGQVGAFTYMFDKEALMEVFINPVGERGELNVVAQHFIQEQIRQIAIEKGMGVLLKDYDPNDPNSPARLLNDESAKKIRQADLKTNLERIGLHMSSEDFKNLFEGFENGGGNVQNYLLFGQFDEAQLSKLPDHLKEFVGQNGVKLTEAQLKKLPKRLKDSIELGRIQLEIQEIRRRIRSGEQRIDRRGQVAIDFLSSEDRNRYLEAFSRAEANFNIAFQMQGATGEKVKKGKGFFYVDKNPHVRAFSALEERSAKIEWILKELADVEKEAREEKKDEQAVKSAIKDRIGRFSHEMQEFYHHLSDEEMKQTIGGLYGIDQKKLSAEQIKSIKIGWILNEIDNGRVLSSFAQAEINLYNSLSEEEKDSHVDHVPVHLAEKLVQEVVNRVKVQHANSKAIVRTEAAAKARRSAIEEVKRNGWKAKIRIPKTIFNSDPNSPRFGEVVGVSENEFDVVDYKTAVKSIYSRYTTHTYWGYQVENTHMLLNPDVYKAALRIRAGISRPEDEDVLASHLLIVDPTLKRLIIPANPDEFKALPLDKRTREITLLQSQVEESFLGHTYVIKDLYKAFLPSNGDASKMRTGYNWEDWGGMMRFTMGIRELAASQPTRFARRLAAGIAFAPMFIDAMPDIWGADGVMGIMEMFDDKIKGISQQGIVGQFGITKFIDQIDGANNLFFALVGTVHEGQHVEGWWMKPTNNNEFLHEWSGQEDNLIAQPKTQLAFLKQLRESYGRLEKVMKLMRPLYSDTRNAGGALRLENIDIFLENGRFNPAIEKDSAIFMNTGTSRHLLNDFYEDAVAWLLRDEPGGGGHAYPEELNWNRYILNRRFIAEGHSFKKSKRTFKEWFFDKAGL